MAAPNAPPNAAAPQAMVANALAVSRAEVAYLRRQVSNLNEEASRKARDQRSLQRRTEGDAAAERWIEWWTRARSTAPPEGEKPPPLDLDMLSVRNMLRCTQAAKAREREGVEVVWLRSLVTRASPPCPGQAPL